MYEKGNSTYAQLLFEAKSISDMMNKADYIEKLYAYDRKLLIRYQETKIEEALKTKDRQTMWNVLQEYIHKHPELFTMA